MYMHVNLCGRDIPVHGHRIIYDAGNMHAHNHSSTAGAQGSGRCPRLTLADGVIGGAAHVEACVTAAVLGLVHLGTAGPSAEGRVVHHAPLGRGCAHGAEREQRRTGIRLGENRA